MVRSYHSKHTTFSVLLLLVLISHKTTSRGRPFIHRLEAEQGNDALTNRHGLVTHNSQLCTIKTDQQTDHFQQLVPGSSLTSDIISKSKTKNSNNSYVRVKKRKRHSYAPNHAVARPSHHHHPVIQQSGRGSRL